MTEGLNQKKLGAVIVLIVALIAPVMILCGYVENALTPPWHPGHNSESLALQNFSINENAQSLNASLTISNCVDKAKSINTLRLSNITQSNSPGIAVSINGTYIDGAASPLFTVRAGDTAIVNMIVPYTSYPNALSTLDNSEVVGITVLTDQAMYYKECNLSGGVSG